VSHAERELEHGGEHRVTPVELFFDLVLVFAFTQVTGLLADDPSWGGVLRGMLVLAALWWAWNVYAWLTSALDVDEGGVRLTMLASMGAMFFVALAVPGSFGEDAVLFGCAYLVVGLLHLVLCTIVARDDPDSRGALLRFSPTAILGASLLMLAGFLEADTRIAVWMVALAIDYLGPVVIGMGGGWRIAAEHFAERYGLIILIALGESIIAIGFGAGPNLDTGVLVAAALGIVLASALWWLYFDVAATFPRRRLMETSASSGRGSRGTPTATCTCRWSPASSSSPSGSRRRSTMSMTRSTRCPQWRSAAAPRCTCSATSRSCSERPTTSFGGGPWGRPCCSP
jgi:low temperature requirement protein LtrA